MDRDTFWAIVDETRAGAGLDGADYDGEAMAPVLEERLATLSADEIAGFARHWATLHEESYRWDLWGAAYLLHGGCSDDSFDYFRFALVGAGREWYERVLADPDALAGHPAAGPGPDGEERYFEAEDLDYVADHAYAAVTGEDDGALDALIADDVPARRAPFGEEWDFDDEAEARRRLPRLAARFLPAD